MTVTRAKIQKPAVFSVQKFTILTVESAQFLQNSVFRIALVKPDDSLIIGVTIVILYFANVSCFPAASML